MKIAILALQGAFAEHQLMLKRLGVDSVLIRNLADWNEYIAAHGKEARLILPGGESTAMLRIMRDEKMMHPLREAIKRGMPVMGTCAGMILLAHNVEDEETRERLATMDITVKRNAYGRQLGSFHTEHTVEGIGKVPMTFIRAPYITKVGKGVEVLSVLDGNIIAAKEGNQLVCSFHPELDDDLRLHQMFISSTNKF